eukprot:747373-Alexandrium_andersonii.AAC.1
MTRGFTGAAAGAAARDTSEAAGAASDRSACWKAALSKRARALGSFNSSRRRRASASATTRSSAS